MTMGALTENPRARQAPEEEVRFWCPASSDPMEFVCASLGSGRVPLHLHEEWQFAVVTAPATLAVSPSQRYLVQPGVVTAVAPFQVHAEVRSTGAPVRWHALYVASEDVTRAFRTVSGETEALPCFREPLVPDPAAAAELVALDCASETGILIGDEFVTEAYEWLLRLLRRHASSAAAPTPRPVERVRTYLHAHVTEAVTLATLATVARLNASYLVRSFGKSVGLPPHRYHAQLRVARAARLLAQGTPATWVAYDCGFADQAHLCRRFKEVYGLTPGGFRAQHRGHVVSRVRAA
jgi:AraC-like DNA-binding protein